MDERVEAFREALETLDRIRAEAIFGQALGRLSPIQAVEALVVPALEGIGRAWEEGTAALSQVYMAGVFCEELVERVLPASDPDRKHQPRSAIAALDDHHLLGKRIVHAVLRAGGFELFDYGPMGAEALVRRALDDRLEVLLISALMLPSALRVAEVTARLRTANPGIKVAVGGAPFRFDGQLWREVGADAAGRNAAEAVALMGPWMGASR